MIVSVSFLAEKSEITKKVSLQNISAYGICNHQQLGMHCRYTYTQKSENNR